MPHLSCDALLEYFKQGEKHRSAWRIGHEHELFILDAQTLDRLTYERIQGLLRDIAEVDPGWEPILEKGSLIGLKRHHSTISLEPGGQIELSTAPHATLHQVVEEIEHYHEVLRSLQGKHGCIFLALGLDPFSTPDTAPWMPKQRYRLMRRYMPLKGSLGLDMMSCTATVQANLDYSSEEDMSHKLYVALALQPFLNAFFVASPLRQGQESGWASFRQHIWTDTDPDRTGTPARLFHPQVSYAHYRDYALQVPMYCLQRGEDYVEVDHVTFQGFMDQGASGQTACFEDWVYHLGTLFPDVRLKSYIETRGADCVPPPLMYGMAAFWVGMLYDAQNLQDLVSLTHTWSHHEVVTLRDQVARQGWHDVMFQNRPVQVWCAELLEKAHAGLERRAEFKEGYSEALYLAPLMSMALSGSSLADTIKENIHFLKSKDFIFESIKHYQV